MPGGVDQRGRLTSQSVEARQSPPQALKSAQKRGHHLGIELGAGTAAQLGQALAVVQARR